MLKIENTRFAQLNKKSNVRLYNFCHYFECSDISMPSGDITLLIYVKKGFIKIEYCGTGYTAKSGDVIVIPSGDTAKPDITFSVFDGQSAPDYYILHLSNTYEYLPSDERLFPIVSLSLNPEMTSSMFMLLEAELMSQKDGWVDVCANELSVILRIISRDIRPCAVPQAIQISRSDQLMNDILDYIHIHYCEKISLQSISDLFFISSYYLSHLFHKKKGISLMQYITRLRLHEAQMLLRTTDYSVKQIAQMTGYQNVNYFFNVFQKQTGMSPSRYKEI